MKTFKEYLAESSKASLKEINYRFGKYTALLGNKLNQAAAQKILKNQEVRQETLLAINRAKSASDFSAFNSKSKAERDAVVAMWILQKKMPEVAEKLNIKITNPEFFAEQVEKRIIKPFRRLAMTSGNQSPEPMPSKKASEEPEEPETKADTPEEPETKADTPEEPETKADVQEPSEDKKPYIDKEEFPDPMEIVKEIEELKTTTMEKIEAELEGKELTREKRAQLEGIRDRLKTRFISYIKKAQKQSRGYSIHPTPTSMNKASTAAKIAKISAETDAEKALSKIKRKQLDVGAVRLAKRGKEVLQSVGKKVLALKDTRTAKLAADAIGRVKGRITQTTTIKTIENALGPAKAKEYIQLLKDKKDDEAAKIAATADKTQEEKERIAGLEKAGKRSEQRTSGETIGSKAKAGIEKVTGAIETGIAKSAAVAKGAVEKVKAKITDRQENIALRRTAAGKKVTPKQQEIARKATDYVRKELTAREKLKRDKGIV